MAESTEGTAVDPGPMDSAVNLLRGRSIAVVTGAGLSTDSGIPDYRGPDSPQRTPMTISEFRSSTAARQRYWARSQVGWARIRDARPNGGHHALAQWQATGHVTGIVTQNVDGLHQAAGSSPVIDLHGRLDVVVCLNCGRRSARRALQERLADLNPGWDGLSTGGAALVEPTSAPDGDADVGDTSRFVVAPCIACGGVLKPDVVFFGENVPITRVRAAEAIVDTAGALLVAGSSLTVLSGLRFVKRAATQGIPVVIVNRGPTRGDDLAAVHLDADCTRTLEHLVHELG